jgi:hypothetical protein
MTEAHKSFSVEASSPNEQENMFRFKFYPVRKNKTNFEIEIEVVFAHRDSKD